MKPAQIAQLGAAPLASLFLLLGLCVFLFQQRVPVGYRVPVLRMHMKRLDRWVDCGETRTIVISLNRNGELHINQDPTTWETLAPTIARIMENRAEPIVYILADSDVSYAQFAVLVDTISSSTKYLHIAVITSDLRHGRFSDCDLEWPESEFKRTV